VKELQWQANENIAGNKLDLVPDQPDKRTITKLMLKHMRRKLAYAF